MQITVCHVAVLDFFNTVYTKVLSKFGELLLKACEERVEFLICKNIGWKRRARAVDIREMSPVENLLIAIDLR